MDAKKGERQLRVYCTSHKVSYELLEARALVCKVGREELAHNFPLDKWWEYCRGCEHFWPSEMEKGGRGREQCPVCTRPFAAHSLCRRCKVVSAAPAALPDAEDFRLSPAARGDAACPVCSESDRDAVIHQCKPAGLSFKTARAECPFCHDTLGPAASASSRPPQKPAAAGPAQAPQAPAASLTFPTRASDYLKALKQDSTRVKPNYLKGGVLVEDPDGLFVLVKNPPDGGGEAYALPAREYFFSELDFVNSYAKYYDPSGRLVGAVWVVAPAVVERVSDGWKLRDKKGILEADNGSPRRKSEDEVSALPPPPRRQPAAAGGAPAAKAERDLRPKDGRKGVVVKEPAAGAKVSAGAREAAEPKKFSSWWVALLLVAAGIVAAFALWPRSSASGTTQGDATTVKRGGPMVKVAGGEFTMGNAAGDEYERPPHTVTVKPFMIDVYEVTREEYARFVKDGHADAAPSGWTNGQYLPGTDKQPVTGVTWDDAVAYANWAGKRLPTEEEWEFAARGTQGRRYPWGDEWKVGMANANSQAGGLADVGTFKGATPEGIYDMAGNAWEWTDNDLEAYPPGHLPPQAADNLKVIRGGYWGSRPERATGTFRRGWPARGGDDYSNTGFRCAMSLPSEESAK